MAARRLLTVLIVLLVLSSMAAALVPIERSDDETSTTSTTTTTTTAAAEVGTFHKTVDASSAKLERIAVAVGDRLGLTVRSQQPAQVEIAGFGVLEDTDAALPAHFDLLAYQPGRFPVRLLVEGEAGRTIATIDVSKRPSAETGAKGAGRAKGRNEKPRKQAEKNA